MTDQDWPGEEWPGTEDTASSGQPSSAPVQAARSAGQSEDQWPGEEWPGTEHTQQAEGVAGTFAREAAHGALPAAGGYAGAAAGFELGSMAAPFAGPAAPVVPFIGAIGGMIAGSMATEKAQDAGLKALGVDDDTQRALNAQANPKAAFTGGLAPAIAGMSPAGGASVAERAAAGGLMAGFQGVQDYATTGDIDPTHLAVAGAAGAAFPRLNSVGEAVSGVGSRAVSRIAGRPNTEPNPFAGPSQDEAASSQQATVTGESSLQQPPPSADGATAGNPQSAPERSSRTYPKGDAGAGAAEPDMLSQGDYSPDVAAALDAFRNAGNTNVGNPRVDVDASLREAPVQTGFPPEPAAPPVQAAPANAGRPTLKLKRPAGWKRGTEAWAEPAPEAAPAAQDVAQPQQTAAPAPSPESLQSANTILDTLSGRPQPAAPAFNPDEHYGRTGRALAPDEQLNLPDLINPGIINRAEENARIRDEEIAGPSDQQLHAKIEGEREGIAQPTAAQAEAGNYAKGHPGRIWKRQFTIETPKGGVREDSKSTPPRWRLENSPVDIGELLGTKGADGDRLDLNYVGTGDKHFVIDQVDPETGKFDEHKIMFAAKDEADALDHYKRLFNDGSGDKRVGAITPISDAEGEAWVNANGAKKKPYSPDFKEPEGAGAVAEPKSQPKVVTAAVSKMREDGVSEAAIAKYLAQPVGDQLAAGQKYLREFKSEGNVARPNRMPTKREYVDGILTDEGKPVQARSKVDKQRKDADVKVMNDAYERLFAPDDIKRLTPPDADIDASQRSYLQDKLKQFLDATAGVTYRPNFKHEPYLLQRAARDLIGPKGLKTPNDAAWQKFATDVRLLRGGAADEVRRQGRIDSDIEMNRRSGDESLAGAERDQAHNGVNETEDQMIAALDRARESEGRFDIPHEEAESMVKPEPAAPVIEKVAKNTKELNAVFSPERSTGKGGSVGSSKGPVALEGSENKPASAVRKIDVKSLGDDYVKNLLERANAPKNASRLDADDIVKQTRAAPKNSTARALGEAFMRDESGAVHLDRVIDDIKSRAAGMRKFFDNIADMEHKGARSYRAREEQSPAERAAFHVAEELHKLRQGDVAHKLALQQWEKSLPAELKDKKVLERIYFAREAGKINTLDPQEQALYARYLKPKFDESDQLFQNIDALSPGLLGPKVAGDHTYRMVKGQHDILNQTSDPFDQQAYSAISTRPHDTMLERRFFSMEDPKGNRFLISVSPDGDGFTVWHNRRPIKVEDPDFAFKEGQQYTAGGKTFTMREALTPEIEQHALFDAGKRAEYYHNAALSAAAANFQMGAIARHLQLLEGFKHSPEMREYMAPPGTKDAPEGWREPALKNFDGWKMTPELADVFDSFASPGFGAGGGGLDTLRKIGSLITKGIFFNPVPHIGNVGVHWAVGRGFRWLPTTSNYRGLAETGMDAIKSVLKQDDFYKKALNSGAGLMYGSVASGKFMDNLAKGLGEAIHKNPSKWDPIARKFGVGPSDLVKAVYTASSHAMWAANDMFLVQAIKENMQHGMGMRQAIIEAERHIPNYRLPAAVMGSGRGARIFAQLMGERNAFVFGPYHYGVFNEYANIVKDLVKGNGRAKLDAIGHLMVMGALAFAVYPALDKVAKLVTGNPDAEVNRRGAMGIPSHLAKAATAKEDPMSALRSTFTLSPLAQAVPQVATNRDWRGKDIIERGDVRRAVRGDLHAAGNVAKQAGGYAVRTAVAPVNTAAQIAGRPDRSVLGGLRDQFLDIRNPSPASRKFDAGVVRRYDQQARQREKKGEF